MYLGIPYLDRLELEIGNDVGYGLRNPLAADDIGYIVGVCLEMDRFINQIFS